MKKILLICAVLFAASLGCKKNNIGGGGLCACSPVTEPELKLVIKSSTGTDLLNDKIAGAYSKDQIKVFQKSANGTETPVNFSIRPPFSYGEEKFNFNSLFVGLNFLRNSTNTKILLKLGDSKTYELSFALNEGMYDINKLLIDDKEAESDNGTVSKYLRIFYLTE